MADATSTDAAVMVVDEGSSFSDVPEFEFMDEIHNYPSIWKTSSTDYRKSKGIKANALAALAEKYKTGVKNIETRYNSIRTRVSRHLKENAKLPSGSGRSDAKICSCCEPYRWLFSSIKPRQTKSNTPTVVTADPNDNNNNNNNNNNVSTGDAVLCEENLSEDSWSVSLNRASTPTINNNNNKGEIIVILFLITGDTKKINP